MWTTITAQQLQQILPAIKQTAIDTYLALLISELPTFGIDTPQRLGGFIAQCAEESCNFSTVLEMDSGERYEGYKMLGNTQPGDGVKFKGRGLIQITGRGNYTWCSKVLFGDENVLLNNPEKLQEPLYAVRSAAWFWRDAKSLNIIADFPETWTKFSQHFKKTYTKIEWLTILINGGLNGLSIRQANYIRARQALNF